MSFVVALWSDCYACLYFHASFTVTKEKLSETYIMLWHGRGNSCDLWLQSDIDVALNRIEKRPMTAPDTPARFKGKKITEN